MDAATPPPNASACRAWRSTIDEMRAARRRGRRLPRLAVCLTGQLRLFMVGFPALARNLLLPASSHYQLDFFYVGPADRSFERGSPWLRLLPGLRLMRTYSARLRWGSDRAPPSSLARLTAGGGLPATTRV